MIKVHPLQKQYPTNESGTKIAVQLDIRSFQQLEWYIELLEDQIDLELAMKGPPDLTNWDNFVKELRKEGKLGCMMCLSRIKPKKSLAKCHKCV